MKWFKTLDVKWRSDDSECVVEFISHDDYPEFDTGWHFWTFGVGPHGPYATHRSAKRGAERNRARIDGWLENPVINAALDELDAAIDKWAASRE